MPRPIMQRYLGMFAGPLEMGGATVLAGLCSRGRDWSRRTAVRFALSARAAQRLHDSVFLALGLCLIWGYTGILSLGQSAFFGLGGYIYGIVGINLLESQENTNLALILRDSRRRS